MKKMLSVILTVSTLAMAVPVSARADTVQVGYTAELLEAPTAAEKTADTRDPNSKLSDGVKKAISEGKENISVYLIFKYNAEEIRNEAEKRAEKEISELDQSEYNEKVIYAIKSKYLKEVNNEYINSILNEIGTDISQTQNKGWLTCTLDQEQINAAEANEKILGIFLDDPNYYLPLSDPLIYKETSESDKGDANNDEQVTITDVYAKIAGEYVVISDKMNDTVILLDSSGEFHIVYINYKDTIINVTNGSELPINDLLEAAASESENSSDVNVPVITKNSDTTYVVKAIHQDYRNALTKLLTSQNCVEKITDRYEIYEDTANYYSTHLMFVSSDLSPKEIEEKYPSLDLIYDQSNDNVAQGESFDYAFNFDLSGISDRSQIYSELKKMLSDGCDFTFWGCMTEMAFLIDKTYTSYEIIYEKTSCILRGDANLDGQVNIADAVLVMQVTTNPDKYAQGKSELSITAQGEKNADVDGKAGLTNEDALLIQKFKLGLIKKF